MYHKDTEDLSYDASTRGTAHNNHCLLFYLQLVQESLVGYSGEPAISVMKLCAMSRPLPCSVYTTDHLPYVHIFFLQDEAQIPMSVTVLGTFSK